jgi:carbamoyltransferase
MNVKANEVISKMPEIHDMFIFPSCGDESNSIGAAYALYAEKCRDVGKEIDINPIGPIYFGTDIKDSEVEKSTLKFENIHIERYSDINKKIGELLSDGKIVARCNGKMEFGARALGNRSILTNPSNQKAVRIINDMIKNRDFWMPFAPTIIYERRNDYIINPKDIKSPYMQMAFDSNKKNHQEITAALHPADLSTRPQILEKEWNLEYYKVIKEFEKETGTGVVLNTSFNLHGFPIVRNPEDALDVFENSGLQYLALGNFLISKNKMENI